jgi:predicted permease
VYLRLVGAFARRKQDADFQAELESHLQLQIDDFVTSGLSPAEARRQALIKFGSVSAVQESYRDRLGLPTLEPLLRDFRFSLRVLAKTPGLTFIIVTTLALGIGVNTAIFSVLNGWLFRPLPVSDPQQLMVLAPFRESGPNNKFSYATFQDFQQQSSEFSGLLAYDLGVAGLSDNGTPHEFVYSSVTGNYFSVLGLKPALGRLFVPGEGEHPGDELRVVLGYSYWQKRFGGSASVLGKQVLVNGRPAAIIGVAPQGFHGLLFAFDMDGYLSLSFQSSGAASNTFYTDRAKRGLTVFGRLEPGVSTKQVRTSLSVISKRLSAQYPATDSGYSIRVIPEQLARPAPLVASFVPAIATLFLGLSAIVLLIAGVNVAGILLARAAARQHEMAIRSALGARRWRLVWQAITEGFLIAGMGGTIGILLGKCAISAVGWFLRPVTATPNFEYRMDCSFDWRVFIYTFIVVVVTALFVSLWPILRAGRTDVNALLHEGVRNTWAGSSRQRLRTILVSTQLGGCMTLIIAAGLFVRTLRHAENMFLGFDPDHVLVILLDPHQIGFDDTQTQSFYRNLKTEVGGLPGVQSVSVALAVPLETFGKSAQILVEGRDYDPQKAPSVSYNAIDRYYFETMRIPLLSGRNFTENDTVSGPRVAIINQAMARRLWPGENPIGKRFGTKGSDGPLIEVVGVAANGQYMFVSPEPQNYFYVPWDQATGSLAAVQVRSTLPPDEMIPVVQQSMLKLAPGLPVIDARSMNDIVRGLGGLFLFRLAASLAAFIGFLGLTLGIVGVYGVVSYSAAQRTREIGIRMAVGADRAHILRMISREGLGLVLTAVLVGLVFSVFVTRVMRKLLLGVSPSDPVTYATAILLIAAVTLIACWLPARRASRVDPMVALRYE